MKNRRSFLKTACKPLVLAALSIPVLEACSSEETPNNPIIGSRSFGEDKFNVTNKSLSYLKGMQSEGIMGSAKHFPGHGDTSTDSHKTLPIINFSAKRINDVELFPYKELIKNNLSTVMVDHMEVPALEKEPKMPSTLSKNIISKLLKKRLKFQGLVITDAMDMKGVVDFNKNQSADVNALLASIYEGNKGRFKWKICYP